MHIANLKKFVPTQEKFLNRKTYEAPLPIKDSENVTTVYLVDDILSLKWERNKRSFLIKWEGYDDPTWEPEEQLRESEDFEFYLEQYLEEIENGMRRVLKQTKGRNMKARAK